MERHARPSLLRLLVVAVVLAGAGLAAQRLWREGTIVRATRDYLSLRRVENHRAALVFASEESGVDPYLLAAIMVAESSGRVDAKSSDGALGLFQLMPITARWRAEELGLPAPSEEELLSDALLNARLGADTMAWLLRTFDGDVERALVAYYTGTGRLKKLVDAAGGWQAWRAEREAAGDSELLAYARRVLRYRDRFRERRIFEEDEDARGPEER